VNTVSGALVKTLVHFSSLVLHQSVVESNVAADHHVTLAFVNEERLQLVVRRTRSSGLVRTQELETVTDEFEHLLDCQERPLHKSDLPADEVLDEASFGVVGTLAVVSHHKVPNKTGERVTGKDSQELLEMYVVN
jgi:hypothetical protein